MPKINRKKSYQFISFGQWSLKHVIFHLLKLTGPAHVCSTTYGLGPASAKSILDALNKKILLSFNFIYDWKIKQYKEEAHNICTKNFPVKITSIHAKITTIINDNFGIVVSGSANWSDSNKKIEHAIIIENKENAKFINNILLCILKSKNTEPKKIFEEIANEQNISG